MNGTLALVLLLCSIAGTFAEELFPGKPLIQVMTDKKAFWTRMYRDIDSLHTVVFNRTTLYHHGEGGGPL